MRRIAEFVVVTGGEVHAERRGELLKRGGKAVGIGFGAGENISWEEDYVWAELSCLCDHAFGEGGLVDMA